MNEKLDRRNFIGTLSIAGTGLAIGIPKVTFGRITDAKPALLGGPKAHPTNFPAWPIVKKPDENALLEALRSKKWGRLNGKAVANFEDAYKNMSGAKHCLGVSSGTSALYTAMGALDIGPGDEVIIPVYTFVATYNVVVLNYGLPRFVDTDIESFQIDANQIEKAITPQRSSCLFILEALLQIWIPFLVWAINTIYLLWRTHVRHRWPNGKVKKWGH